MSQGLCWYCYWGWPKLVHDIYMEAVVRLGGRSFSLHFGPAHIVWEDENFDAPQWCLDNFDKYSGALSEEEKQIVRWSLERLAALPLDQRCVEPEGYDGDNPEKFPPPLGVVMVKR